MFKFSKLFLFRPFEFLSFNIVSYFGFRASNFGFYSVNKTPVIVNKAPIPKRKMDGVIMPAVGNSPGVADGLGDGLGDGEQVGPKVGRGVVPPLPSSETV